jgi:hypothetical protein
MNVPAALLLGFLAAAGLNIWLPPSPALDVATGVILVISLFIGVRAMLSHVEVTDEVVRYQGVFRSHSLPRSRVVTLSEPGPRLRTLLIDVPDLAWRSAHGIKTLGLWCLPLGSGANFGVSATYRARDDLRVALGKPHH